MPTFQPSIHVKPGLKPSAARKKAREEEVEFDSKPQRKSSKSVGAKSKPAPKEVSDKKPKKAGSDPSSRQRPLSKPDQEDRPRKRSKVVEKPPVDEDPDDTDPTYDDPEEDASYDGYEDSESDTGEYDGGEGDQGSSNRGLTVLDEDGRPLLPASTMKRLNSMFGPRAETIVDMLEANNSDGATTLIARSLLQMLVKLLPVLERNVRRSKGQRGVYQLNQVISQVREMCNDIQASRDRANIGNTVVERFIRPAFLDIAVQITTAFVELEGQARNRMSPEDFATYKADVILPLKKGLADYITRQYQTLQTDIVKAFT